MPRQHHFKPKKDTSWNKVSSWYDRLVGEKGSDYHQNVIIPGALAMLDPQRGEKILDVACGQGVFTRCLREGGAEVTGIDSARGLIRAAQKRSSDIKYLTGDATDLRMFQNGSFDAVSCIMAIMNIDPLDAAVKEMSRVLKKDGRLLLVLNHPCFRIPRQSGWAFDAERKLQFRRIDSYMSTQKIPIKMHPGYDPSIETWTFHRPLSRYFKTLAENGLVVDQLEEWVSHRKSIPGPMKKAEDRMREEIPLFLALAAIKLFA
ncbi:MAG: class I SAM-dependent methyltransferase [Candidatus Margulisiibacteriota bacterium]